MRPHLRAPSYCQPNWSRMHGMARFYSQPPHPRLGSTRPLPQPQVCSGTCSESPQRYLWLGGWFVLTTRDCCFGRFEATSRVGPVTERFGGRASAAAQSKRSLWNCVGGAVPIDRRHIIALDQIGPVLHHFDRCHLDDLPHSQCYRDNLPHTACCIVNAASSLRHHHTGRT